MSVSLCQSGRQRVNMQLLDLKQRKIFELFAFSSVRLYGAATQPWDNKQVGCDGPYIWTHLVG
jgi:hypothetical protein